MLSASQISQRQNMVSFCSLAHLFNPLKINHKLELNILMVKIL